MAFRAPTSDERRLLLFLSDAAAEGTPAGWMDGLLVESMSDGGMGSLRLWAHGAPPLDAVFHRSLAACEFDDADGTRVIATLYANSSGAPFELDMWKVDSSPLIRISSDRLSALRE